MIDAKRLLEQFLSGGQARDPNDGPSGAGETQSSTARRGGSPLAGLPGGIGGAVGSVQDLARRNPLIAGALAGGLASVVLGSNGGRKLAKGALTYGGIAAIGALAYKAYRDYQGAQNASGGRPTPERTTPLLPPPADSPFAIANAPQGEEAFALDLVRAMVAAAKADGHIDEEERARIVGRLSDGGLDPDEVAFLEQELAAPLDIERIVRAAKNKEEAMELYAASVLAITPNHPAERAYLDMLAARLEIEPELAKTIKQTIDESAGVADPTPPSR